MEEFGATDSEVKVRILKRRHMHLWWNGRHAGLRNQCFNRREGSTPSPATNGTITKMAYVFP